VIEHLGHAVLAQKVFPQHIQVEEHGTTTAPYSFIFNITFPVFKLFWPFLSQKKALDKIFVDRRELIGWVDLFFKRHSIVADLLWLVQKEKIKVGQECENAVAEPATSVTTGVIVGMVLEI
jgi:hypothetical protein